MKKIHLILLIIYALHINCTLKPAISASVGIKVEGFSYPTILYANVIETERNDTTVHLDTVFYRFPLAKTNKFSLSFDLKTEEENGDYIITVDSIKGINYISNVEVYGKGKYSLLFNGEYKTEKDYWFIIKREK